MLSDKTNIMEENTMGQVNNNTMSRKGKHLNYEERIKLEALYKCGLSATCIGEQLHRHRRTIEREIRTGMVDQLDTNLLEFQVYSADAGQVEHDKRGMAKGPSLKIGNDHELAKYLEANIGTAKNKLSPYAVIENIKNKNLVFKTNICCKTVYNYLDKNLFLTISNKDLLVKKDGKKRDYHKIRQAITNTKGTSIADRPIEIDLRSEYGHWEMDTVVGKQGTKPVLLVLSERKTRQELIFKIASKSQGEVIKVINRIERQYGGKFKDIFKSITTDNGGEFLDFEGIEKSLFRKKKRTKMYFAHPYSSWERGTNENINKMIRRFVPKGVDIGTFSHDDISRIQTWMNNYPRKVLGGKTANMVANNQIVA
jgi:IS30 family transposase